MKVIYERSIIDRLREVRSAALRDRQTVRKVVLTKAEMAELFDLSTNFPISTVFMGILLEQEPDGH